MSSIVFWLTTENKCHLYLWVVLKNCCCYIYISFHTVHLQDLSVDGKLTLDSNFLSSLQIPNLFDRNQFTKWIQLLLIGLVYLNSCVLSDWGRLCDNNCHVGVFKLSSIFSLRLNKNTPWNQSANNKHAHCVSNIAVSIAQWKNVCFRCWRVQDLFPGYITRNVYKMIPTNSLVWLAAIKGRW